MMTHQLWGQISIGTWVAGGQATFSITETDQTFLVPAIARSIFDTPFIPDTLGTEIQNIQLSVVPELGAFVNDRWLLGANLGFNYEEIKFKTADQRQRVYFFAIGAFLRRYFLFEEFEKGGLTGTLRANFQLGQAKFDDAGEEDDTFVGTFSPSVSLGIFYFVTPEIAIETNWTVFGYNAFQTDADEDDRQTSIDISTGADLRQLSFGLRWYFYD